MALYVSSIALSSHSSKLTQQVVLPELDDVHCGVELQIGVLYVAGHSVEVFSQHLDVLFLSLDVLDELYLHLNGLSSRKQTSPRVYEQLANRHRRVDIH